MFLRNRWYLRASSLLAYNTATNFMPTIKPVKWQTLNHMVPKDTASMKCLDSPGENMQKPVQQQQLKREYCRVRR